MGIRPKLLFCLITALTPLIGVGQYSMHMVEKQLSETTQKSLSDTLRLEAARITKVLSGYSDDARALASGAHVKSFVSSVDQYNRKLQLHEKQDAVPIGGFDGFAYVDPGADWPLQQLALRLQRKAGVVKSPAVQLRLLDSAGEILGESIGFTWEPANPDIIDRAMRTEQTLFGDAFRNMHGEDKLGMVTPITSDHGEVVGALVLETLLDPIINVITNHEGVGYSSEAHIAQPVAEGGAQFISQLRFDRQAAFNRIIPKERNLPVVRALDSLQTQVIKSNDYRGVLSYLAIQTIPDTGWGLIVKIDAEEALAPVTELRHHLQLVVAASAALLLIICVLGLWPVARRLKKTAQAARQIMNGDLKARILDDNNDEISEMANSINMLAHELELDQKKRSDVEAQLRRQALQDELTGLYNRKHANAVIAELHQDRQHNHTVMFLDLNGFKDVNDLYGHSTGDMVLRTVAERLTACVPEEATLARWGGDEFVIILPETSLVEATELALALHNALDAPLTSPAGSHRVSGSIGLATSSEDKTLEDALIEADTLMYEQKNQQRVNRSSNGVQFREIERALKDDALEIWYQPSLKIIRPGSYHLSGADTQLRIHTHEKGYVLPDELMQQASIHGISSELDKRLLTSAVSALQRWKIAGIVNNDFQLSLKLTKHTLGDPCFTAVLADQIAASDISARQLILELPADIDRINPRSLFELRNIGVLLAIRSNSINPDASHQLTELCVDIALIDEAWHKELVLPGLHSELATKNIELIARNVNNADCLASLHDYGIKRLQGDLFDAPLRAVDFVSRWGQANTNGIDKRNGTMPLIREAL
ncbi:MAG: diguanylate cyclase [Granulosicoccus sp.]